MTDFDEARAPCQPEQARSRSGAIRRPTLCSAPVAPYISGAQKTVLED